MLTVGALPQLCLTLFKTIESMAIKQSVNRIDLRLDLATIVPI